MREESRLKSWRIEEKQHHRDQSRLGLQRGQAVVSTAAKRLIKTSLEKTNRRVGLQGLVVFAQKEQKPSGGWGASKQ